MKGVGNGTKSSVVVGGRCIREGKGVMQTTCETGLRGGGSNDRDREAIVFSLTSVEMRPDGGGNGTMGQ